MLTIILRGNKYMKGLMNIVLLLICSSIWGKDYSYKRYIPEEEEEPITKEELAEKCLKTFPFMAIYLLIAGGVWIDYRRNKTKATEDNKRKQGSITLSNWGAIGLLIVILGGFYFIPLYWRALFTFGIEPILYPPLWILQWVLSIIIILIILLGIPIGIATWLREYLPSLLSILIGIALFIGEVYLCCNYSDVLLENRTFLFPEFDSYIYEL